MTGDHRYRRGIALFQGGKFFEAHEELELLWRATPPGPDREFLQGLIQLAVSLEHWRRGNPRGAWGQYQKALRRLAPLPSPFGEVALAELLADTAGFYARADLRGKLAALGIDAPEAMGGGAGEAVFPCPRWSEAAPAPADATPQVTAGGT
jgi:hypothetical protein